jgi:hypothetical protein
LETFFRTAHAVRDVLQKCRDNCGKVWTGKPMEYDGIESIFFENPSPLSDFRSKTKTLDFGNRLETDRCKVEVIPVSFLYYESHPGVGKFLSSQYQRRKSHEDITEMVSTNEDYILGGLAWGLGPEECNGLSGDSSEEMNRSSQWKLSSIW